MRNRFIPFLSIVLLLAGCQTTEMPYEPVNTDEMRPSPCACVELEYQPQTFEWVDAAQA
ncbi:MULTISPECIES: hypothetical protein [unclassified Pseudovibrio]|uniref:hypothetical protein n=1 Tax=unclassified Pseudovibrio TaxID=2627060 RepID=UPI0007B209A4|nr:MULTISPECIES: hypothetical protein [unclassified Pseudovibrio]KZK94376.1 hypothetical protein PsW74_04689 [Pseudovibrio sp. W74]KZL06171.1 hypothetical protein PsAD14_04681 [Pseudovibrio sp. Ad14]